MTFSRLRCLLPIAVLSLLSSSVFSQSECEISGLFASPFGCSDPVSFGSEEYATVQIGDQCWFAENLRSANYAKGEAILNIQDNNDWVALESGAWADYDNDPSNGEVYGHLYNWYAVDDARGLCPSGWHVPSDLELTTLEYAVGGVYVAGGNLKEAGTAHWNLPNTGADNSSGFTALGSGYRSNGVFANMHNAAYFWSSTPTVTYAPNPWYRKLYSGQAGSGRNSLNLAHGLSIRCVQDQD